MPNDLYISAVLTVRVSGDKIYVTIAIGDESDTEVLDRDSIAPNSIIETMVNMAMLPQLRELNA